MPQRNSQLRQTGGARERRSRDDIFSQRKKKSSSTASEAQSIQKSQMRTHDALKNELQRLSYIGSTIEEDGHVLQQTMDHHKSLNTKNAKKALTALERAQQYEQRFLMLSVFSFFLVAFYIFWARILISIDVVSVLWSWF